jgi:hypothetical protein
MVATGSAPETPPRGPVNAWLVVRRGLKLGVEYPLYAGRNYVGRTGEQWVDIDLTLQEPHGSVPPSVADWSGAWGAPDDPVRCYPQHAVITADTGTLFIEDLHSGCGTFVNRRRVYPEESYPLQAQDVIQIGTVQLEVFVGRRS